MTYPRTALLIFLTGSSVLAQDWTMATPSTSPAAATYPRMAYDLARGRMVSFGGWDAPTGAVVFQQTWEYDGVNWTLASPVTVPTERCEHMMTYDLVRGRVVMYGGQDFNFSLLDQVLEWNGTDWTDVTPAGTRPPARVSGGIAYSNSAGGSILWGGSDGTLLLNDTWNWNGTAWTQINPASSPPGRAGFGLAYDVARNVIVMFGGWNYDFTTSVWFGDTWEFDGITWTQINTANSPSPRDGVGMAYDQSRQRIVMFGGSDAAQVFDETWEFDGRDWYQVYSANRPQANAAMAMAYDIARSTTVVFGGYDGAAAIPDTWEFGGNSALYRTFGAGCSGSNGVPTLTPQGIPTIGGSFMVNAGNLPTGGGFALLVFGLSNTTWNGQPLPADLQPFGMPGCQGFTSVDDVVAGIHAAGATSWTVNIPANPNLAGLQVYNQVVSVDPGAGNPLGAVVSNAGNATLN